MNPAQCEFGNALDFTWTIDEDLTLAASNHPHQRGDAETGSAGLAARDDHALVLSRLASLDDKAFFAEVAIRQEPWVNLTGEFGSHDD